MTRCVFAVLAIPFCDCSLSLAAQDLAQIGQVQLKATLSSFLSTLSTSLGTHHFLVLFLQLDGILGEPWDEE